MERHIEDPGDFLRDYEDMDEGEVQTVVVADEAEAEKHLKAIRYWRKELERVKEHAKQERDIVDRWEQSETTKIGKRLSWHEFGLTNFLKDLGKATWSGVFGKVRRFAGRERIEVTDLVVFEAWAKENAPNLLRVKVEPDKAEIKAYIAASGEQPPGVEITTGADSYKVEVV